MSIAENLKKGTSELLLLKILSQNDMYGYQLTQELASQSRNLFILKEGSLYPILYRLEEKGYISCKKSDIAQGRVRIYYHLEPIGNEYYKVLKEEYLSISKGIYYVINKNDE